MAQNVYLTPTDGDGSEANTFRSRCLNLPGKGNVPLGNGWWVCVSNTLPADMTGVIMISSSLKGAVATKDRTDISAASKIAVKGSTADEIIKELVIPKMALPKSGDYIIKLGKTREPLKVAATIDNDLYYKPFAMVVQERGVVLAQSAWKTIEGVAHAITSATEDWTCADNTAGDIDCDLTWLNITNMSSMDLVSNQVTGAGNLTMAAYANSPMDTVDHAASATAVSLSIGAGVSGSFSICIRQPSGAVLTFYRTAWVVRSSGELNSFDLVRTSAGVSTTLDTDTQDGAANDVILVQAVGDAITGKVNGIEILSATDPSGSGGITTGNYGAIRGVGADAGASWVVDNFSIADYVATATGRNRGGLWY